MVEQLARVRRATKIRADARLVLVMVCGVSFPWSSLPCVEVAAYSPKELETYIWRSLSARLGLRANGKRWAKAHSK